MSATLSYDLKQCMGLLCKDSRWNVLTVLILHANIRNRCFVGMDTIADMATAGNVNKATRVKKWLMAHGAFELVSHDKRVGEECALPQRQHVYQLTGVLKECTDIKCDCHSKLKSERHYLHYAKDVISGDNITEEPTTEVIAEDNFNHSKVIPIENINGDNLSNTNTSKEKESDAHSQTESTSVSPAMALAIDEAAAKAYQPIDNHTEAMMQADVYIRVFEGACQARGAPQRVARTRENKRIAGQWYVDGYKDDEIRRAVDLLFDAGKPVLFKFLDEKMSNYRNISAKKTPVADDGALPDEWGVDTFVRKAESEAA